MTTAPRRTPTINTTTLDMLLKKAVLDDAISVEIVLGNEGMLGRIRGQSSRRGFIFSEKAE